MKFKLKFNTIGGPQEVTWTQEEAMSSDLAGHAEHLVKLTQEGATGFTFQHPLYGRVTMDVEHAEPVGGSPRKAVAAALEEVFGRKENA